MTVKTKLTLRMDAELIERAKAAAEQDGISLSRMVADIFRALPDPEEQRELSPWARGLIGAGGRSDKTWKEWRAEYMEAMAKKYS